MVSKTDFSSFFAVSTPGVFAPPSLPVANNLSIKGKLTSGNKGFVKSRLAKKVPNKVPIPIPTIVKRNIVLIIRVGILWGLVSFAFGDLP